MKLLPEKITRKALLNFPMRQWDAESVYDSLYLVPTGRKHDSGYSLISIVGRLGKEAEQAAWCDDINWSIPNKHPYDRIQSGLHHKVLRTDCLFPSGILHMWASGESYFCCRFKVGASLSSTEVTLLVEPRVGREEIFAERMARIQERVS